VTPLPSEKSGFQRFCAFGRMSRACGIVQVGGQRGAWVPANCVVGRRHTAGPLNTKSIKILACD
jgi:hypothetical protein